MKAKKQFYGCYREDFPEFFLILPESSPHLVRR